MRLFLQLRKYITYIVLGIFTALAILAVPAFTQDDPVTIRILMHAIEAKQWEILEEKFEEEHPNINLEIVEGPNATNLVEDLYTSSFLLGDSPYDLVYMDIVWTPKFAAAGWLADLSDRVSDEELAAFLDADVEGGRYKEGLYRMPFRSDAGLLYYREDLLEAAGYEPPETTQELMEISQALQADGEVEWGYVWQGKQYEGLSAMFVELLDGFGGFWIDPETKEVGLDRPEAIAAVNFLRQTINDEISPPGVTTYTEEETRRFFQSGKAAFLRNWPYVWSLANSEDSQVAGKIALKPMVHAPGYDSSAAQGGWGIGMVKSTDHPEEAWEVIEFLTSEDAQKAFVLEHGYLPSRRSLFTDADVVDKYPQYPQFLEVQEQAVLRPPIAQYSQASDILQRYLSAAITERMTPEAAMEKAAEETRNLLDT
mgnify:CR=1 FL=1